MWLLCLLCLNKDYRTTGIGNVTEIAVVIRLSLSGIRRPTHVNKLLIYNEVKPTSRGLHLVSYDCMKSFTVLCNAVLHSTIFFCIIVWAVYTIQLS